LEKEDVKENMTPLRKLRKQRGLSTTEVGAAIGVDQSTYSRIETTGKTTPERAAMIVAYFGGPGFITELHVLYPERFPDFMEQGSFKAAS
jgi:transcriptional regulator with XRE-family HTH domain